MMAVAAIVFFNVSGGPLGSEQVVSAAGPLIGIATICAFGIAYAVPQAMMTAELSTAFPDNGGYSLWVKAAFGDMWGVQESYWSWFSGVVDAALYPVLLYSCAEQLFSHDILKEDGSSHNLWACILGGSDSASCIGEYGTKLLVLAIFTVPNILSSKFVGRGLAGLGVFVMAPFVVLVFIGAPQMRWSRLAARPRKMKVGQLLSVAYWNVSGFDSASTFAGEVRRPQRSYPRALGLAVVLVLLSYIFPLGVAAAADPAWEQWRDGSLTNVANMLGGRWLAVWVVISATFGNWGLYSAELLEDSYQLLGMSEAGLAPKIFSKRHATLGTPINAILLQFVIIGVLVGLDFDAIMCVDNFFSAAASALEFAAALKLRHSYPAMPRPYRIPMGTVGLAVFFSLPVAANFVVMYVTATATTVSLWICLGATVVGFVGYMIHAYLRRVLPFAGSPGRGGSTCYSLAIDGANFSLPPPAPQPVNASR